MLIDVVRAAHRCVPGAFTRLRGVEAQVPAGRAKHHISLTYTANKVINDTARVADSHVTNEWQYPRDWWQVRPNDRVREALIGGDELLVVALLLLAVIEVGRGSERRPAFPIQWIKALFQLIVFVQFKLLLLLL